MKELDSVYNPQRDAYNQQISGYKNQLNALPGQQQAQEQGLNAAKTNAFEDITTGANRRGVAFGGIPLEEQNRYTGENYLPALANMKSRFAQMKDNLGIKKLDLVGALEQLAAKQRMDAYGIRDYELQEDARARAAAASSGGGGGGGFSFSDPSTYTTSAPGVEAPQMSLRDQWQQEANAGDWNAQVALNYAGNDGRYDGPVNSQSEMDILRGMGIQGNYYLRQASATRNSGSGRTTVSSGVPSQGELRNEAMRRALAQYGIRR